MSKRAWYCIGCRKSYLRKKSLGSVECPNCHSACETVGPFVRVPSPKLSKEWDKFWANHLANEVIRKEIEKKQSDAIPVRARKSTSGAATRVAYLTEICKPLIKTLNHSSALAVNQLAGHAANADFWVAEAMHCLAVIDGYPERFARLRAGQAKFEKQHDSVKTIPIRRNSKDTARLELRREVTESIERFLYRCHREKLLSDENLSVALGSLGE